MPSPTKIVTLSPAGRPHASPELPFLLLEQGDADELAGTDPVDLFIPNGRRGLSYRRFDTTRAAVHFVRDRLTKGQRDACILQSGDRRLVSGDIARLLQLEGESRWTEEELT